LTHIDSALGLAKRKQRQKVAVGVAALSSSCFSSDDTNLKVSIKANKYISKKIVTTRGDKGPSNFVVKAKPWQFIPHHHHQQIVQLPTDHMSKLLACGGLYSGRVVSGL
jgi:hypothetical protein